MLCRKCKKTYTLEAKRSAYSEETHALALKIYYAGASGRGVGKERISLSESLLWTSNNEVIALLA